LWLLVKLHCYPTQCALVMILKVLRGYHRNQHDFRIRHVRQTMAAMVELVQHGVD